MLLLIIVIYCFRVPLRNARKKSVAPQTMVKMHDDEFMDADGELSPQNSITSINSISSLLKEKLAVSKRSQIIK